MNQTSQSQPLKPLLRELRWLVHLRWIAGAAVIIAASVNAMGMDWLPAYPAALGVGVAVLLYNTPLWFALHSRRIHNADERLLMTLAWIQIGIDLICLTLVTMWTGGVASPFRGFFVLHMVLSSLLLSPSNSYLAALIAVIMVVGGLWIGDGMPADRQGALLLAGWALVLFLTVFLTTHITADLRRRDTALRDQHKQLQAVLDTAADGIITINERGIIQSTNPAADLTFGYRAGELLGKNVKALMPEPYFSNHDQYIQNYLTTRQAKIIGIGREVVGLRKDGTVFPLDLAVSEVSLDGRTLFTGIVRDITEQKQAEQELRDANDTLRRQQQAMIQHEKMAAMGQMAAGIVHEISNPLASMDTMLQLVQRYPDKFNDQTVGTLREQVTRIHHIVRQLTDFGHPNEAAWEVRPLNEVVQTALEMVRFDHRIRRVQVVRDLDPNVGQVRVMIHQMQQVIINMILNALDAMAHVEQPRLIVSTKICDGWKAIEITDNGEGIAPEHLQRVFEPFFTTKSLGKGTGLGLSISYSLVERHGGHCEVSSTVGQGTTFPHHAAGGEVRVQMSKRQNVKMSKQGPSGWRYSRCLRTDSQKPEWPFRRFDMLTF